MVLARTAKTRGGTLWDRKPKSPGPLTSILEQQHCHNDAREWEEGLEALGWCEARLGDWLGEVDGFAPGAAPLSRNPERSLWGYGDGCGLRSHLGGHL